MPELCRSLFFPDALVAELDLMVFLWDQLTVVRQNTKGFGNWFEAINLEVSIVLGSVKQEQANIRPDVDDCGIVIKMNIDLVIDFFTKDLVVD